ncbi:MAG: hypothetical protein DHS20C01_08760 [marine bacterium B5-7]|nr:MAG: hypothetical protein DHS20C01_08760 [marine bacterium B5-7]
MKSTRFAIVVLLALAASSTARAADWNYRFTPYLWATGLSGTEGFAGRPFEVDASFGDLLEVLDIGLASHLEADNGTWGWFGDVFYAKLSDDVNLPVATLDGETKQTIAEAGLTYRLSESIEALGGLRYQKSDSRLSVAGVGALNADEDWVDGFVGMRWSSDLNDRWGFSVRGDVGAGDSDLVWHVYTGIEYRISDRSSLVAGYRYLDTDYENDGFTWDIVQSGLGLGYTFNW